MKQPKIIDNTENVRAIKEKYGRFYYQDKNALQEAAALWGLKANEHGVTSGISTETVISEKGLSAQIYFAHTRHDHWLIGLSIHTTLTGLAYAPSVWDSIGYADYDIARTEALEQIRVYFMKNATKHDIPVVARSLEKYAHPQLNLF